MADGVGFTGVFPIGDTDVHNLPVKMLGPAIGYYTRVLGFAVVEKTERTATLRRGGAQIGLAVNGKDTDQASCYFAVTDVAALREELARAGIEPSEIRRDEHGGRSYLVVFAQEPYGVCFCFGQPAPVEAGAGVHAAARTT